MNASSYAAGVAATTGSSGRKLITDGVNQNVFSDLFSDKLTGSAGQDLFLVDTSLDEADAVKDLITDAGNSELSVDIDSM